MCVVEFIKKKEFEPMCERMDDGTYVCKGVLKSGDVVLTGEGRWLLKDGKLITLRWQGNEEVKKRLEKHLEEFALK